MVEGIKLNSLNTGKENPALPLVVRGEERDKAIMNNNAFIAVLS